MSKHPIDHDRNRDDAKVAKAYSRIERENAGDAGDPKVKVLTKSTRQAENTTEAGGERVKKFLKIDRETSDR